MRNEAGGSLILESDLLAMEREQNLVVWSMTILNWLREINYLPLGGRKMDLADSNALLLQSSGH